MSATDQALSHVDLLRPRAVAGRWVGGTLWPALPKCPIAMPSPAWCSVGSHGRLRRTLLKAMVMTLPGGQSLILGSITSERLSHLARLTTRGTGTTRSGLAATQETHSKTPRGGS